MLRPHTPDGKFEFIVWDTDHGSGMPYKDYGKVTWNTFEWALSIGVERTESAINTVILRRLMEYEPARNQFINRFADMMNTVLMPNSTSLLIDSLSNLIANDMKFQTARWNTSYKEWENALKYVKNFHDKRPAIIFNDIKEYYNIKRLNNITLKVNDQKAGKIKINTIIPEFEDGSWTGTYFSDIPVTLQAIPNDGYHFVAWKTLSPSKQTILDLAFESDTIVEALFYPIGTNLTDEISLHQNNNSFYYSVYLNPASSYIVVKSNAELSCVNCKTEILVFNLMGEKCIHETHYGKSDITLETKNLKSGLYIIKIFENDNIEFSGNISIMK